MNCRAVLRTIAGPARRLVACLPPLVAGLAVSLTPADSMAAPFVTGFDRFGRHQDIDALTAGRLLLSELSCTACHQTDEAELAPKRGPKLTGAADRLQTQWMRAFLLSPQATKPGTTMPDVLAGVAEDQRAETADALVAFLRTQHEAFPKLKAGGGNPLLHEFWNRGNAATGRTLYHTVGCVACHAADEDYETVETKPSPIDELLEQLDPEEIAEMGLASAARSVNPVPHAKLAEKYSRKSLAYFLLNPELSRPGGRMPSLKLEPQEAADIVAWLIREQSPIINDREPFTRGLIDRGRQLFVDLRCGNCHDATGTKTLAAKPLPQLVLNGNDHCFGKSQLGRPHFPLDDAQTTAVRGVLSQDVGDGTSSDASTHFRMLQLNCYGCHERNGRGGVGRNLRAYFETVGNVDIGDEGRIPPPLTGVGRKLQTGWLQKVLAGTGNVRPFMRARMPMFPTPAVAKLPEQLANADRRESHATDKSSLAAGKELIDAGRKLMDIGCVQCHSFQGESLPGVLGIDLAGVPGRMHSEWLREFLLNPSELKPRTRMPSFFPGGKSQNPVILNGAPQQQITAMLAYLRADTPPLPSKIDEARSRNVELIPTDRPILLRTFMPEAGTSAIAVGFPVGVHFAFDAEQMRLAEAWRGRFLDAQGTWFVRFAPPAEPLGEQRVTFPSGPPLAILEDRDTPWPLISADRNGYRFGGYRLNAAGVPTFLYRFGPFNIEDQIEAVDDRTLKRRLTVRRVETASSPGRLWFRANAGQTLKTPDETSTVDENGLTVRVPGSRAGHLRLSEQQADWRIPVTTDNGTTIEVDYSW